MRIELVEKFVCHGACFKNFLANHHMLNEPVLMNALIMCIASSYGIAFTLVAFELTCRRFSYAPSLFASINSLFNIRILRGFNSEVKP